MARSSDDAAICHSVQESQLVVSPSVVPAGKFTTGVKDDTLSEMDPAAVVPADPAVTDCDVEAITVEPTGKAVGTV